MDDTTSLSQRSICLVQRLFDAFSKQVDEIEDRSGSEDKRTGDDVRVLGGLAKTLETLMSLAERTADDDTAPDIETARAELSERIGRLLSQHHAMKPDPAVL